MAKKKIATDGFGNASENKLPAYKKKPTPWVEGPVSRRVRLERERYFWKNNIRDRKDVEEYVKLMQSQWDLQDNRKEI